MPPEYDVETKDHGDTEAIGSRSLDPMNKVAIGLGGWSADLYVGDMFAASDMGALQAHGITSVLNCAVNVDVNYVSQALDRHPGGTALMFGFSSVRVAKVGMIDGPGNHPSLLLAACHALEGLFHQDSPSAPNHPPHQPGNVLVHCRAGMSRAVTVSALYLHGKFADRWPTFGAALDHVRAKRGLHRDEFANSPTPWMLDLAREVLNEFEEQGLFQGARFRPVSG